MLLENTNSEILGSGGTTKGALIFLLQILFIIQPYTALYGV